ncbi:dipeptide/oligopeptide/nickel ABC transporter permease/ATP-binding protein [Devosia sp.]|uniref:dipeptide/oligopeptide/nickel ABC transporter permease/ATP-binding protein n=1 Tax=Devosia sp. TaxID=1871048 RepID=UPI002F113BD7
MSTDVATIGMAPTRSVRSLLRSVPPLLLIAVGLFLLAGIVGGALLLVPDLSKLVFKQSLSKAYAAPFTKGTLLGADQLGRPIEWRLLAGLGISLGSAAAVTVIATLIGLAMGLLGGFFGRTADRIVTLVIDVTWAYPTLLLAVVVAGIQGPGVSTVIWALALTLWAAMARIIRAQVLVLREQDFVLAVRALGYSRFYIATRHLTPNLIPACILMATLFVALTIVAEAGLSFIGLGAQSPTPSLGKTLAEGFSFASSSPWPLLFGSATIIALVTSLNAFGDYLRDVLDPKGRVALPLPGGVHKRAVAQPAPATIPATDTLVVEGASVAIHRRDGSEVTAVSGFTLSLTHGSTVGIVGESGSGKSVAARAMSSLLPSGLGLSAGRIYWNGVDIATIPPDKLRDSRGKVVGMVFQDARASMDPLYSIGRQITEALRAHVPGSARAHRQRVLDMLSRVGLNDPAVYFDRYPHELSGGQMQRAALAAALILEPQILIADEPTTGLDATTQKRIVTLVKGLQSEMGMTIIWISHDVDLVSQIAENIIVMYAGEVVEAGKTGDVLVHQRHPYTLGLLKSRPDLTMERKSTLRAVPGSVPEPGAWPPACRFAPRCERVLEICGRVHPQLAPAADGRQVRCHNPEPPQPEVQRELEAVRS